MALQKSNGCGDHHSRLRLEATTGFEPVMAVLQTAALGHLATSPLCRSTPGLSLERQVFYHISMLNYGTLSAAAEGC